MNTISVILVLILIWGTTTVLAQRVSGLSGEQQNLIGNIDSLIPAVVKKISSPTVDTFQISISKPFVICKQQFKCDRIKLAGITKQAILNGPKLLTIHGSISYDFIYRSKIDTPINQEDFRQHTERVSLNILYKEKYPLKVSFVLRQSNSPFFSNFADVNFQFDRNMFARNVKQELINKITLQLPKLPDLIKLENELKNNKEELQKLKGWISSSSTLQKIIEERERLYYKKLNEQHNAADSLLKVDLDSTKIKNVDNSSAHKYTSGNNDIRDSADVLLKPGVLTTIDSFSKKYTGKSDSLQYLVSKKVSGTADSLQSIADKKIKSLKDSTQSKYIKKWENRADSLEKKYGAKADSLEKSYTKLYEKNKLKIDSLEKKVRQQQKKLDSLKLVAQKNIQKVRLNISRASGEKELKKIAKEHGISLDSTDKWARKLTAIRNFSIGRSLIDYTELTAQNITVTGVNVEYNPSYYAAFAAGKIDYRFRDFFSKRSGTSSQYLVLGRFGWGNPDKTALIFTVFQGRKNQSNFSLSDSVSGHVNILGYSVEGIWKQSNNTGLSIEFAKSTYPTGGRIQRSQQTKTLWNFSEKSNMGINIKAQTAIASTNTKLSGFYRKTGENFQSFSLFSYNTDQTAWQVRLDQDLFKNRVSVTGMLRRNDFTNPFAQRTFKTSTVFKSIQVNIRFPKYPSVSFGYYPGTQLYVVNKEVIRESAYYILNGSMFYGYHFRGLAMHSTAVYNQYFNKATDSGFVFYKGTNYYLSQTIFLKKLQLQGGYSYTKQPELKYYTLDASFDYSIRDFFRAGAGTKYSKVASGEIYLGERIQLSASLKKLGTVQLQYEKSFLPGVQQSLYPVETGRVSWFKIF